MLKDEIEKKNQFKKDLKKLPELTCQIYDSDYKTKITLWKAN
jgi:hypothetical protein